MTLDHLGMGEGFEFFFTPNFPSFLKPYFFFQGSTFKARGKYKKLSYINFFNGTLSIHLFALAQWFQEKYIYIYHYRAIAYFQYGPLVRYR